MRGSGTKRVYPLTLVLLAGGDSRRMRRDKALLPVNRVPLIEYILQQLEGRFLDTLISVSESQKFQFLKQRLVVDEEPGFGPMMGIKTALTASQHEKSFIIACDIPTINYDFLDKLINAGKTNEIAVSLSGSGRVEPLFAVYSKSVLSKIDQLLNSGIRSILPLLDSCQTQYIGMESDSWYKNLNTLKDYKTFLKHLE
jgi:molybdopterin-guanine dinucleotide biosynthesis protein A